MSGPNSTRTDVSAILRPCRGIASLILILSPTCGFVFCTIHIIKANTPIEHVFAMFGVAREYR